jgi:glucose-1-phosphate thymidylyltransferase
MKCLVLAAGYATRLYPLTKDFPKPLLDVNGKTIINWLLEDVDTNTDVSEYFIVTNHRFVSHFNNWKKKCGLYHPIHILDDGSTENDNRLGAVKDIAYAIEQYKINDDLLVLAGDNVLNFSLKGFVEFFEQHKSSCVMRYYESEISKLQKTGVATIDTNSKIVKMQEKPLNPESNWAIPPFYIYKKEDLRLIEEGINSECNTDAPGDFIAWLCGCCAVYAYEMPGKRYDIGNIEGYNKVKEIYHGYS